ncbi:MAG: 1-acyl-sn-glycerol-3-phosphate acyltransferase [Victivallales bacterium]|nr:1-acyl-sn-glycerol-3-phosphate acyltransferase [Victivallales bacterium]
MNCNEKATDVKPVSKVDGLFEGDSYATCESTPSLFRKLLTWNAPHFYLDFFKVVRNGAWLARHDEYTRQNWFDLSYNVVRFIENHGGRLEISGMSNFQKIAGPVLFVGNHMSILETIVIPCLVLKYKELCITMKKQLFDIPVFGTLLTGFRTIAVSRENPIDDYKTILREGGKSVDEGYSILLFPQTTRTTEFDPDEFNSVGVKLAKRVNIPIIPVALKTDFWGNGRFLKDLGPVDRGKKIHFRFGEPINVEGNGKEDNQQVIDFIQASLAEWSGS